MIEKYYIIREYSASLYFSCNGNESANCGNLQYSKHYKCQKRHTTDTCLTSTIILLCIWYVGKLYCYSWRSLPPSYNSLLRFRQLVYFSFKASTFVSTIFPQSRCSRFGSKVTFSTETVSIFEHLDLLHSPSAVQQLLLISCTLHNYICRIMEGSAEHCLPSNDQWSETAMSEYACNACVLYIWELLRSQQQQALCRSHEHFLHFNKLHSLIAAAVIRPFDPYLFYVLVLLSTIYTRGNKLLYVCWYAKAPALYNIRLYYFGRSPYQLLLLWLA